MDLELYVRHEWTNQRPHRHAGFPAQAEQVGHMDKAVDHMHWLANTLTFANVNEEPMLEVP